MQRHTLMIYHWHILFVTYRISWSNFVLESWLPVFSLFNCTLKLSAHTQDDVCLPLIRHGPAFLCLFEQLNSSHTSSYLGNRLMNNVKVFSTATEDGRRLFSTVFVWLSVRRISQKVMVWFGCVTMTVIWFWWRSGCNILFLNSQSGALYHLEMRLKKKKSKISPKLVDGL